MKTTISFTDLLQQARDIIAGNKTDKAAREFMTNEQRDALAEDFAAHRDFLAAAHFTTCADKRKEFERLFDEYMKPKGN